MTHIKIAEKDLKRTIERLKKQNKRLATLNILSDALTVLDDNFNKSLKKSLNAVLASIDFDAGAIFLFDKDERTSSVAAYTGLAEESVKWVNDKYIKMINETTKQGLAGRETLDLMQPVLVGDINAYYTGEKLEVLEHDDIASVASIPLKNQDSCLGLMFVASRENKKAELFETDFLDIVGKQIGMAVANNRLAVDIINAKEDWENTFNSIDNPVTIHDKDFNILKANKAALTHLNCSINDLKSKKCYELFHHSDKPISSCPLKKTVNSKKPASTTISEANNDNTLLYSSSLLTQNGHMPGIVHMIQDVTLQRLSAKKLLETSELERKVVSEEIHDGMLQLLYGALIYCRQAEQKMSGSDNKSNQYISEGISLIEESIDLGRKLISGLRPSLLDNLGLSYCLKELIGNLFKDTEINISMDLKEISKFDNDIVIYRIAQELLVNAYKHSGAKNIEAQLEARDSEITLSIRDDGRGFDLDTALLQKVSGGHIGLQTTIERAQAFGGQLTVDSKPGCGTRIKLMMPKTISNGRTARE